MTYYIENTGEKYLLETARTRAEESDTNILNILNEIHGYLAGYYEKKANHWFNRLTGRDFDVERTLEYWKSFSNEEIVHELNDLDRHYGDIKSTDYINELERLLKLDAFIRRFANVVTKTTVDFIQVSEAEYQFIFK